MATSISAGPAWAMDGPSTDASVVRTFGISAFAYNKGTLSSAITRSGVLPGPNSLQITAPGGMAVSASAGFWIQAATLASNGAYSCGLLASGSLTVATADPTNPRIDLVCATIQDNGDGTSDGFVQIITGTPAPSPSAPSLPATSLALAQVTVPNGASTITTGNIADQRQWTTPIGAIMPINGITAIPAIGYTGAYCHDLVTGRLVHNPAGTAVQPVLLPFPAQSQQVTSPVGIGSAGVTVASVSVTTDGNTDLDIYLKWGSIYASAGSGEYRAEMQVFIDSAQVDGMFADGQDAGASLQEAGGAFHVYTDAIGATPAAGSHTIKWVLVGHNAGSDFVYVDASASGSPGPAVLRVSAVPL